MKDLALHILDIVQNSLVAGATLISIEINEELNRDSLTISIGDNGSGMTEDQIQKLRDPYFTSRTTRKVGLGIPLLHHNAVQSGGYLNIYSEPGKGTEINAIFKRSHIDRPPLGDISGVVKILIGANPEIDFIYRHRMDEKEYILNSKEIKDVLGEVPVSHPEVLDYINGMILENLKEINVI